MRLSDPALEPDSGKRAATKAANREAILRAARAIFAEMGYEAASVRDIIRGTDLASGTFYNYFKSKEEVRDAIADDAAQRFRPILRAVRAEAASFEDYVERAFRAFFQFIAADFMPSAGIGAEAPGRYLHAATPQGLAIRAEIREALLLDIAKGAAPALDVDFLCAAAIGIGMEVGDVMLARRPIDIEAATAFSVRLFLAGLAGNATAK